VKVRSIAIGSDHRGIQLKKALIESLKQQGYQMKDVGTSTEESCDYPDFGAAAAKLVSLGECERAIVICGSGVGMSMAANKIKGVRAALCHSVESAEMSRRHNDANVLALSADQIPTDLANAICFKWLSAEFEGGRHARRVQKISDLESQP